MFRPLQARFRREFRTIRDEAIIHNILDKAAQRYVREAEAGTRIEHPEAFAWRTIQNLAVSELRRSEEVVSSGSVAGPVGERTLLATESTEETAEQIYARIHASQIYSQLSEKERRCAVLKTAGYNSARVGQELKISAGGVDKMMQRLRERIRNAAAESEKFPGRLRLLKVAGPKSPGCD